MKTTNFNRSGNLIISIICFALLSSKIIAYTTQGSGTVSGTWAAGTYYVTGNITITNGTVLTLDPNVVIKFAPNTYLMVQGTLTANGNITNNVIFTAKDDNVYGEIITGSDGIPSPGDWDGIYISNATGQGYGNFNYCKIRYGGKISGNALGNNIYAAGSNGSYFRNSICEFSQGKGILVTDCNFEVSNSTISNNSDDGLNVNAQWQSPIITDNTFTNNGNYAAYVFATVTAYSGNTGSGNLINGFGIKGHVSSDVSISMSSTTFPYILIGLLDVSVSKTLTIPAGIIIKGIPSSYINVIGTIDINGTIGDGNQVIFTSINDDNYGGDTKGDGGSTSPAAGDWDGIYLSGSSSQGYGYFDYCRIRYGGKITGNVLGNNIYVAGSNGSYFRNSYCEFSQDKGILVSDCNFEVSNCTIANNAGDGLNVNAQWQSPVITNNTFTNNGSYAAYVFATLTSFSGNTGSGNSINGFGIKGHVSSNISLVMSSTTFPYILTGLLDINVSKTLTIPAGTIIKAVPSSYISVIGTIDINGASGDGNQVIFTSINDDNYGGDTKGDGGALSPAAGDWDGIYLSGSSSQGYGYFDYCRIRYGGKVSGNTFGYCIYASSINGGYFRNGYCEYSNNNGIGVEGCAFEVSGSTIANNSNYGLYVNAPNYLMTVSNNSFINNGNYAAYIISKINSFSGNTGNGNSINGFGIRGLVSSDAVISSGELTFPFILIGQITIDNLKTLTVNTGTIIKCVSQSYFTVNGTLDINGVSGAGNMVVITSINDDTYGGDTKGDGTAVLPSGGDWDGIYLNGSSYQGIGNFEYCYIRYGGRTGGNSLSSNIYNSESDAFSFLYSNSDYSQNYGIYINNAAATVTNSTFTGNGSTALYVTGAASIATIDNNTFNNNNGYGVYLNQIGTGSYAGNSGTGNTQNGFGIYGGYSLGGTWTSASKSFPFIFVGADVATAKFLLQSRLTIGANTTVKFESGAFCYIYTTAEGLVQWNSGSRIWLNGLGAELSPWDAGVIRLTTRNWPPEWIISTYMPGEAFAGGTYVTIDYDGDVMLRFPVTIFNELSLIKGLLKVEDEGSLTFNNSAKIIRQDGSLNFIPNFGSSINLEYSGSTGVVTGNEIPFTDIIDDFTVNNTGGITINNNIKINNILSLNAGIITTNLNTITLGSSISDLGTLIRTSGKINGNFKRWFGTSTSTDILFPLGTSTNYRPANISFTTAPTTGGTLTTSFISSNPGTNGLPLSDGVVTIENVGVDGYWILLAADGLSGGTYNVDMTADGFTGITDYTKLHLLKRTYSSNNWSIEGTHSECTGSNTTPVLHRVGLTTFSEFSVGSTIDNPFPVELILFEADITGGNVNLNWGTATELDNYGFYIERKSENDKWMQIGFVDGFGNTNSPKSYSFVDKDIQNGRYCYRLKQIDNNNNISYSKELEIEINFKPKEFVLYQNYPNPFNPVTIIKYSIPVDSRVIIKIFNTIGEELSQQKNEILQAGYYEVVFDINKLPYKLTSGVYFVTIKAIPLNGNNEFNKVKKMILLK